MAPGPVESSIARKLSEALRPASLELINDSAKHASHAAMRAQGGGDGESHFDVKVVSSAFEGKTKVQRHRMVYSILSEELSSGLHALSLKLLTPSEAA